MLRKLKTIFIPLLLIVQGCRPIDSDRTTADRLYLALTAAMQTKKILIIGDSLTQYSNGFAVSSLLGPGFEVTTHGVHGFDFQDWTLRLDQAFTPPIIPDIVIVVLGTNDGYRYGPNQFIQNVRAFHRELRRRTAKPVIYALVPRTNEPNLASRIVANNLILKTTPSFDPSMRTVDLDTLFQSAPSYPPLYLTDPIHPTEAGYRIIREALVRSLLK